MVLLIFLSYTQNLDITTANIIIISDPKRGVIMLHRPSVLRVIGSLLTGAIGQVIIILLLKYAVFRPFFGPGYALIHNPTLFDFLFTVLASLASIVIGAHFIFAAYCTFVEGD